MTEFQDAILVVDLGLEKADAGGEGNCCIVVLVSTFSEAGTLIAEEGRVVGAHMSYVIVIPIA